MNIGHCRQERQKQRMAKNFVALLGFYKQITLIAALNKSDILKQIFSLRFRCAFAFNELNM